MGPPVKFGITDPISLQEASDADRVMTERMMEHLETAFPAETPEGMAHRHAVLQEIERMLGDWVIQVGVEQGLTEEEAGASSIQVTTLGSYRLGVVHPGSDIDTLCIAPPHIAREEFFSSFAEKLDSHEHVSECVPIPDAYTPIIKLKMRGVCIDLLFARLVRPAAGEAPEDVVKADDVLKNMDDKSVRCINGFRVAELILQLVPNQETFRSTLRFIKYWARRRGIYSNVLGFFGGITWSLLVARVCQLYPYYAPSQLVTRFFRFYHSWKWSIPVQLCEIVDKAHEPGLHQFRVWNPKTNQQDKLHIMPVITPAFPAMNSTHNVTETTKRILLEELKRGYEMVRNVEMQKATWSAVHDPHPFFTEFKYFLWVEVLAKTDEAYHKYSAWVESKLRILVMQLELVSGLVIHPNPIQYDLIHSEEDGDTEWPFGCGMFIALSFSKEGGAYPGMMVEMRPAVTNFLNVVDAWPGKESFTGQFMLKLRRVSSAELPEYATSPEAVKRKRRRATDSSMTPPSAKKART
jgi:poly(A) polymerase